MATQPKQPCRAAGCAELVHRRDGYCAAHLQSRRAAGEHHRHNLRLRERDPRYQSVRWRNYTKHRLLTYPMCQQCNAHSSAVTDHILAVGLGGEFWNPNNHAQLCHSCHNAKRAAEQRLYHKR